MPIFFEEPSGDEGGWSGKKLILVDGCMCRCSEAEGSRTFGKRFGGPCPIAFGGGHHAGAGEGVDLDL